MAFKLTKQEQQTQKELADAARQEHSDFETAVEEYNEAIEAKADAVREAFEKYQTSCEALKAFADDIANERRTEYDEKSEKWQESERASNVEEWISSFENFDTDLDDFEIPDALDAGNADVVDNFENLENQPCEG